HRLLVAPDHRPPGRQALGQAAAPLAHGIAAAGILQLDHLGAEVAEDLAAEGAGDQRAHLDDPQAGKRALGGGFGHGVLEEVAWNRVGEAELRKLEPARPRLVNLEPLPMPSPRLVASAAL